MISVIIPNYNNAAFVAQSIHSALGQSQVSEVIVIDNNSSDHSVQIIESITQKDDRVILLVTDKNQSLGAAYCRNIGLDYAKGKYISFLDSDDVYLANRFEKSISILEADNSIDGTYDDVWSYDSNFLNRVPEFDISMPQNLDPSQLLEHLLLDGKTFISIIGLTLRAEVAKQFRMDSRLQIGEDSDYIWRLAFKRQLVHSKQNPSLIKRRMHGNNITKNQILWDESRAQLFDKWFKFSIKEKLPLQILGHFWRMNIHYQGINKGLLKNPYKVFRYLIDIIKQPKLLTYLLKK